VVQFRDVHYDGDRAWEGYVLLATDAPQRYPGSPMVGSGLGES